ncbi:MAG: hypothetical protein ABIQ74_11525 [Chitinophagales bacterium]
MITKRQMYHTQENRGSILSQPVQCIKSNAWLGSGFYFWYDLEDALQWGNLFKGKTGSFQIYEAQIDCQNIFDTVFNEEHYQFWKTQIEKIARRFYRTTGVKPSIKQINEYFTEKGTWKDVDGILFQDLPENQDYVLVIKFWYRKRIQMVVFDLKVMSNFAKYLEQDCSV